jgi:hypothetical protein
MARSSRSASTTPTAPFTAPRARVPSHSEGTRIAKTTVHPTATNGTAHHLSHKPSTRPATIAVGITACVSHGPTADRQIWRDQRWWSDDGGYHQRVRTGGCMQTRVVSGWIVDLGIPTGSSDRDLRDRDGPFGAPDPPGAVDHVQPIREPGSAQSTAPQRYGDQGAATVVGGLALHHRFGRAAYEFLLPWCVASGTSR